MNTETVEQLAELERSGTDSLDQMARARFETQYNQAVGWCIARTIAQNRVPFPVPMIGRDQWVFAAFLFILDPQKYADQHVEEAYQIHQDPGRSVKLKALLIAGLGQPAADHLNLVAEKTGIPRLTVEAYETLFFNVLDRHRDGAYISNIVYPEGRVVEFNEDYFETTPVGDLLLRAAYNHRDLDLVLRLAGMTDAALRTGLHDMLAEELESRIMGNALLMAMLGLHNQRSAGLERAMALLTASQKQPNQVGDSDTQTPYDMAGELKASLASVPPITEADRQALQATAKPGKSYWHDEEGNIMPLDHEDLVEGVPRQTHAPSAPMMKFPEPVSGIWKNKDFDKPVVIVARLSAPGFPDHFLTIEGSGIPASEVFFN